MTGPAGATPARSRFGRDVALLLGIPFVLLAALLAWWRPWHTPRYDVPPGRSIFSVVSGTWDWASADQFCDDNAHTIHFSSDSAVMTITLAEPWVDSAGVADSVAVYDLQEVSRNHIRGKIRGESRLTKAGEPVVWDLVLTSPDTYRWHRTDWSSLGYTGPVQRCPEPITLAPPGARSETSLP